MAAGAVRKGLSLPAGVAGFTGRADQIASLDRLLAGALSHFHRAAAVAREIGELDVETGRARPPRARR